MLAVSLVTFVLVSVSPIDPVQANVGQTAYINMSEAKRAQLAEYWGVNTPLWELLASVPTFWLGLLFLIVFSVQLGWFPFGFSVPIGVSAADVTFADALHHLALPALTLSVIGVANIALHTREKTIDVLESDYVRFARARGLSTWGALRHHGLRNLALPALTLQFASISEIFGGSVLVEQVFSYPGLGQAAVTAGLGGDAALLVGIALFSAAFVFTGNLIASTLYGVVDPRMRKGAAHG